MSVSMERKGAWDAPRSWAKFRITRYSGLIGFYFRLGRLHGGLQRQAASLKPSDEGDCKGKGGK